MNRFSPEKNYGVIKRSHSKIWVLVTVDIQTTRDGVSETSHVKVTTIQHLIQQETESFGQTAVVPSVCLLLAFLLEKNLTHLSRFSFNSSV